MHQGQELSDRNIESEGKLGKLVQNVNRVDKAMRISEDLGRHDGSGWDLLLHKKNSLSVSSMKCRGHSRVERQ